jgi:hypothetical protein
LMSENGELCGIPVLRWPPGNGEFWEYACLSMVNF